MRYCKNCIFDLNKDVVSKYNKDETIFFEGEEVETIFLIKEGIIKLEKIYENGEVRIIDIVTKGDYVALLTILKDVRNYIVSAVCLTDVLITPISKKDAVNAYTKNLHFKETCLSCAAHRLGVFQDHTFLSTNTDVTERILATLHHLGKKFGTYKENGILITLPINKSELANMVGLRRETLSRKLSKMEQENLIKIEKNKYFIRSV